MLKGLLFLASAAGVALVALIGHWQTDKPAGHDSAFAPASTAPTPPGGVPWLPLVLIVCAALGVIALWVAWRRRGAPPVTAFPDPRNAPPRSTADVHTRWHCILTVNGVEARRDYIEWPAADDAEMAREIEQRFAARYGADLPPDARIRARVVPVYSR